MILLSKKIYIILYTNTTRVGGASAYYYYYNVANNGEIVSILLKAHKDTLREGEIMESVAHGTENATWMDRSIGGLFQKEERKLARDQSNIVL